MGLYTVLVFPYVFLSDGSDCVERLGSRHFHKEIKLQKAIKGMDGILYETGLILIRRHTNKCNTFNEVDFEAFSKSAYVPLWYSQFQ